MSSGFCPKLMQSGGFSISIKGVSKIWGLPLMTRLSEKPDAMGWRASILKALFAALLLVSLACFTLVSEASAQGFPKGMKEGSNSARTPIVKNGVVTFSILPGDCQSRTYGDGRGESDCRNLNSKSYLSAGDVKNGSSMRYSFDVRVAGGLIHKAFHNPRMVPFTGGPDSRLSVAIWQGNLIKNHIVWLDLDSTRGLTFMGKQCAAASRLKEWTRFELIIKWTDKADGVLQAKCNGRVVLTRQGVQTDQNFQCNISTHCEPGKTKHPKRINAGFGIFHDAEVVNGKPIRPRVLSSGLLIQMRNLEVKKVRF